MLDEKIPDLNWALIKRLATFCFLVFAVILLFALTVNFLVVPLFVSLFFTFLLLPLVERLDARRILPRGVIVFVMLSLVLIALVFASINILPKLYIEIIGLANRVPDALRLVEQEWLPQFREWVVALGVVNHQNFDMAVGRFNAAEELTDHLKSAISTLWDSVPQVFSTLIHLILIPVLTFFFLKNFHKIRTFVLQIVPQDIKQPLKVLVLNTHITLHSIVKGQATVAGVLAILYVIGFSVIGLPSAFSIGLIAGICRFIPYLDVLVGGILAFIVILSDFSGWYQILSVIVVFVIVQSVDGLLITPRIVGERAGLHPLVVILSILTFAEIWGFWGVVIAIPTVALVRVIWQLVLPYYFASRLYRP